MLTVSVEKINAEYDFRTTLDARLCAVIMAANGAKKRNGQPFETEDFLPSTQKKNVPQTLEQYEEIMRNAVIAMGGTVQYNV